MSFQRVPQRASSSALAASDPTPTKESFGSAETIQRVRHLRAYGGARAQGILHAHSAPLPRVHHPPRDSRGEATRAGEHARDVSGEKRSRGWGKRRHLRFVLGK